jgi:hypothetical protein
VLQVLALVASAQLLNYLVGHAKILIRTELYHGLGLGYDAWSEANFVGDEQIVVPSLNKLHVMIIQSTSL